MSHTSIAQHLTHVQERHGHLSHEEMKTLAEVLGVPPHRVQEVASCFPSFRIEQPAPMIQAQVCRDLSCHVRNGGQMLARLEKLLTDKGYSKDQLEVNGVSCLGRCDRAPILRIRCKTGPEGYHEFNFTGRTPEQAVEMVRQAVDNFGLPEPDFDENFKQSIERPWKIDIYAGPAGGVAGAEPLKPYSAIKKFVREFPSSDMLPRKPGGEYDIAEIPLLNELKSSNLLGMGGAGMPAFRKWSDVLNAQGSPKYIVCNADESEPATFKDRELMLRTPHLLVEGMVLAGLLTDATNGYVYIRHEYEEQIERMKEEIARAVELRMCGKDILGTNRSFQLEVFTSPGGYICGEQSALIEAMEDRRAEPRPRPPELMTNGLRDKPTIVNNVETYSWVPLIAMYGGKGYASLGRPNFKGARFFSISGDLAKNGVYEVPIGITLGEVIKAAGGMRDKLPLKCMAPSGPSGGFLPARLAGWGDKFRKKLARMNDKTDPDEKAIMERFVAQHLSKGEPDVMLEDLPLDLIFWRNNNLMLGAGFVVYADTPANADITGMALNATEFFRNESCGKCIPCRLGTDQLAQLGTQLQNKQWSSAEAEQKSELIKTLARVMENTSICGLGAVAFNPMTTLLEHFPKEVQAHVRK